MVKEDEQSKKIRELLSQLTDSQKDKLIIDIEKRIKEDVKT